MGRLVLNTCIPSELFTLEYRLRTAVQFIRVQFHSCAVNAANWHGATGADGCGRAGRCRAGESTDRAGGRRRARAAGEALGLGPALRPVPDHHRPAGALHHRHHHLLHLSEMSSSRRQRKG